MIAPTPRTDRERIDAAIRRLKIARAEANLASLAMDGEPDEKQLRPLWFETNKAWHAIDVAICALEDEAKNK